MCKKVYSTVFIILMILMSTSCGQDKPEKPLKQFTFEKKTDFPKTNPEEQPEEKPDQTKFVISNDQFNDLELELGVPTTSSISETIKAAGYLEVPLESKAEVRSFIGGYLLSTPLLPGDYVKNGQYLISLENMEYIQLQQEFLQTREEFEYAEMVYERKKKLSDEKITSLNSLQESESEYNSKLANYKGLAKKLQLININPEKLTAENIASSIHLYAPIDGYITKVNAVKGYYTEPTDVIFEIINTNHLHLELKVYEKDILNVKKGQKVMFHIPEAHSETYTAEVFLVGKTIEDADKTVKVHCHISDEQKLDVIAGMYVEAEIHHESSEAMCLPTDAFIREEGDYFVFILTEKTDDEYIFEKTKVEVGSIQEDCVELIGESKILLSEKQLLVEGAFEL